MLVSCSEGTEHAADYHKLDSPRYYHLSPSPIEVHVT